MTDQPTSVWFSVGRFASRNKVGLVWTVVALALYWLISASTEGPRGPAATSAPAPTAAPVAAAPRVDPMKIRCADQTAALLQEVKPLMKARKFEPAYEILHDCRHHLKDAEALALYEKATIEVTKLGQARNAAAEREEKARKKREGVRIGMSQQDALDSSWGHPRKVNRTTTANRVREQWVYDGGYLYFTDGVLTSVQN